MAKNTPLLYGKIDFMQFRKWTVVLSLVLMLGSVASLLTKGLSFGIDFTGGTLVEVSYDQAANVTALRQQLQQSGFDEAEVALFGSSQEVVIRVAPKGALSNAKVSESIFQIAQAVDASATLRRVEFVGPKVGEELTTDGGLAMLYALIGILIYIAFRFEWRFALGSVSALIHDVILTLGFFSVFGFSFDLTVLAAILAVIGYSLNDTIVVFDRIRENFINLRKGTAQQVVNKSLNDMLARTVVTSLTTLLVLAALALIGGEIIHNFALALIFGVVVGTYSSIYVAGNVSVALGVSKIHFMPAEQEGADEPDHELEDFNARRKKARNKRR